MSKVTRFTQDAKVEHPIICGAMYPCSNPELVAAASEAGALGVVQPLSLIYVFKYDLRTGLRHIRSLTKKPYGFNVLTEASSKTYLDRMRNWVDIALEEDCRFFITALGNPRWIVEKAHQVGAKVYHDVSEKKWALKALDAGVDGFICVNNRAGGHAGPQSPEQMFEEIAPLGKPIICAGGVGDEKSYAAAIAMGYDAVQMGTRFIATTECNAHDDYKAAILKAKSKDIVLTEKLTGVPVAIINTASVEKMGTKAGWLASRLLKHPRMKHWMRLYYMITSLASLKKANLKGISYKDFFQAGKSVEGIDRIEPCRTIIERFARALG